MHNHNGHVSVSSVSVHILANNALRHMGIRAHHASAHGGLSVNGLSDICLSFFEMILSNCLKLCLTVEHSIRAGINDGQTMDNSWINASSREFTVSSIGCAYRAELILGR